jgi:excisionase family DNA binding protein
MPTASHIRNLRQALATCRRALEEFESALQGLEEVPDEKENAPERSLNGHLNGQNLRLLSLPEVCQELGEERGVVRQRLTSGEIPSLKLGRTLKVRQPDLEEYIRGQRGHHPPGEKNGLVQVPEARSPLSNG